ncbi:hypothetical protein P3G55_17655 [Leptospira sp. 96542]|nr:hypothetical protein [Leptospira sp. 96542]
MTLKRVNISSNFSLNDFFLTKIKLIAHNEPGLPTFPAPEPLGVRDWLRDLRKQGECQKGNVPLGQARASVPKRSGKPLLCGVGNVYDKTVIRSVEIWSAPLTSLLVNTEQDIQNEKRFPTLHLFLFTAAQLLGATFSA